MRLRSIEAQTFGLLRGASLNELGDGLNVICGPNESGKTSFREIVRMVLYGFPSGKSKDNTYFAPDGSRSARLVFEEAGGRWALTRWGEKKGTTKIEAISGPDRPLLREDIVGSVTDQTYRVLFGFGLDELPAISTPGDDAVLARVYGESVASGKSLKEVRDALTKSSEGILSRGGGAGTLAKDIWKAMKAARARISELESMQREFAADQARLKSLESELADAKARFDEADAKVRLLALDAQKARSLTDDLADLERQIEELTSEIDAQHAAAKRCKVDERLLKIGPELQALLDDAKRVRDKDEYAQQREELAAERTRKAASLNVPEGLRCHDGDKARLEEWRAEKAALQAAASQAAANADRARAHATGERAKEEAAGSASGQVIYRTLAAVLMLVGIAGLAAGLLMNQPIAAGIGVVTGALAVVLILSAKGSEPGFAHDAVRAEGEAVEARAQADSAAARLSEAQSAWEQWLESRGLSVRGTDVAAVQSLLDDASERDVHLDAAASFHAEAQAAHNVAAEWADKLVGLVKGPLGLAEKDPESHALAIRARQELERVLATRDERDQALKSVDEAESRRASLEKKAEDARTQLSEIASAHGVTGHLVASLAALEAAAKEEADGARESVEAYAGEFGALRGRLDSEGRDAEITMVRQELEGLTATALQQGEEYLVESLALALVDGAIKRYEEERQPDVVLIAQGLFSEMTDGRYTSLRVPAGMQAIDVVTAEGRVMTSGELSSGAREQLYLALRVALVSNLGSLAPALPVLMDDIMANYDEERVRDAMCAIRELVKVRQVLFFTCHESTAEALTAGVEGTQTFRLQRCVL